MAYSIEEEQEINQLKEWWKENAKTIIAAFIIGVGGMFGWRYWQSYQANKIAEASSQYEQVLALAAEDLEAQKKDVAQFVQSNNKTAYAVFALLDEAKDAVAKQDFATAEGALKQALEQSQDDALTSLAALRLGAVQFQLGQFDSALATLNQVKGTSFNARKALLAGDIQVAKGDNAAAKTSYEQAQQIGSPLEQQMAQMKLNNL